MPHKVFVRLLNDLYQQQPRVTNWLDPWREWSGRLIPCNRSDKAGCTLLANCSRTYTSVGRTTWHGPIHKRPTTMRHVSPCTQGLPGSLTNRQELRLCFFSGQTNVYHYVPYCYGFLRLRFPSFVRHQTYTLYKSNKVGMVYLRRNAKNDTNLSFFVVAKQTKHSHNVEIGSNREGIMCVCMCVYVFFCSSSICTSNWERKRNWFEYKLWKENDATEGREGKRISTWRCAVIYPSEFLRKHTIATQKF